MTLDAVGGVWRYAMDLAAGLRCQGMEIVFAGLGPAPSAMQTAEAKALGQLVWLDAPLDWMAASRAEISAAPAEISRVARDYRVDLLHLNLPSQAAGIDTPLPVVVVSHSCVVTWFAAVRRTPVPPDWGWQRDANREGFDRANAVLSPSMSHANALQAVYGPVSRLKVVHNASRVGSNQRPKKIFVFAAGRWWDEGKNGAVLDRAAAVMPLPVVMAGSCSGPNGQRLHLNDADDRGPLTYPKTIALMQRAQIVVSPSVYEPFGLTALEAARCGAALVLSDTPTYRELWDDCALFFDPHEPQSLASACMRLSEDEQLRGEFVVRSLERSRGFSLERQAASMLETYAQLMNDTFTPATAEQS
ncbi:glycosyltransferase family 4 protein [Rhizobium leguminosarum]|uniref:glycosyltransferase family 4 protein n=1 Tax=Rhizobium leguminosarum TaxID=384 RepID=UPI001C984730|nr:glycosyltransferase family 4 protein [Rhizobium leguminosarum]MBY5522612.1 glycosyltransferase family 4 protein [Rhizobium leguminosarum]MBY5580180.1 glycosyltransferase family 4 protein [Rhizobium leguminosarum]